MSVLRDRARVGGRSGTTPGRSSARRDARLPRPGPPSGRAVREGRPRSPHPTAAGQGERISRGLWRLEGSVDRVASSRNHTRAAATADRINSSCRRRALRIARMSSHSRVLPSMSVKRNVTVPRQSRTVDLGRLLRRPRRPPPPRSWRWNLLGVPRNRHRASPAASGRRLATDAE